MYIYGTNLKDTKGNTVKIRFTFYLYFTYSMLLSGGSYCATHFLCHPLSCSIFLTYFFFKDFIYLFLEKGEGRGKERKRNINVWLPLACPQLGTWPTTQACALTGNRTGDL